MSPKGESGRVAVAFSGGRDSTALLHATARAAQAHPGQRIVALHVHHGLSVHADAWLQHAEAVCEAWSVQGLPIELQTRQLKLPLAKGDSIEAVARHARYQALAEMAKASGASAIWLAHHQQDQAETFLLQAMRGAGVAGLAAMPHTVQRQGLHWVRPWLNHPREAIEAYVARYQLPYIEDDSNANTAFARNRLRLDVWPALKAAFPQAQASLADAASRAADALAIVSVWATQTLPSLLDVDGASLKVDAWAALPAPMRREMLKHWYTQASGRAMSAAWLMRLSDELVQLHAAQRPARWLKVDLSFYRGCLQVTSSADAAPRGDQGVAAKLCVAGPGTWRLASWGGCLEVTEAQEGGVLPSDVLEIWAKPRVGGEQFQISANRPARALKKQYQAFGVPEWQRGAPIFYSAKNKLVYVPGLGIDARVMAPKGVPQWALNWVPDAV